MDENYEAIEAEEESRCFVFTENPESKLYREFLTKWEKTWSATDLDEGEDETEEKCDAERYFKEKRRSSKQMFRKSKQFIDVETIS